MKTLTVAGQIRVNRTEEPELQSALSQLSVFIEEFIPKLIEAWSVAAPYAQVGYHGYELVKNTARLSIQHPKEVSTIFRAAVKAVEKAYFIVDKENAFFQTSS